MEHIRAAEDLSRELGGTDRDVKQYFFSLPKDELDTILNEYQAKYGAQAADYARATMAKWKSGAVTMSGMVAERLYNLLPPRMPLQDKLKLTESLWRHVGPASSKTIYVSPDADIHSVEKVVREYFTKQAVSYEIPKGMEKRFNWLAQGDVSVKQQLLNHFRALEKDLLTRALQTQLPVLQAQFANQASMTTGAAQVLCVGKHELRIEVNPRVEGVSETRPPPPRSAADLSWLWWLIGIALVLVALNG